MKKLSLVFGAAVGLLLSTSCLADTASGIDMYQSKIIVQYWRPTEDAYVSSANMACLSPQGRSPLSCGAVGSSDAPCTFERRLSLLSLSPADPDAMMEKIVDNSGMTGCFQRTGRYRVFLELHDNAGNIAGKINSPGDAPTDVPSLEFDVKPASPAGDTASDQYAE